MREREEEREERSPLKYAPNLYQDRSCDWVLHKLSEQIADLAIHFTLALSRAVEPLKQVAQKISLLQIGIGSGVGRGKGRNQTNKKYTETDSPDSVNVGLYAHARVFWHYPLRSRRRKKKKEVYIGVWQGAKDALWIEIQITRDSHVPRPNRLYSTLHARA